MNDDMILIIKSNGIEHKCHYDPEDHELILQYKWYLRTDGYAVANTNRRLKQKHIAMHRLIMEVINDHSIEVDHINHERLDNRRFNLRLCNRNGNARNTRSYGKTSKYLGVSIKTCHGKYKYIIAQIHSNEKNMHLGTFKTEQQAAQAYDIASKKYFGEFANLNFK